MSERLIFIYDTAQAEYILRYCGVEKMFKIGQGNKGDTCVSFYNCEEVREALSLCNLKLN